MNYDAVILGIDPGLDTTGWAVIATKRSCDTIYCLDSGIIKTKQASRVEERLLTIYSELSKAILIHQPHKAAIEDTFVNSNSRSSLLLAQARGGILLCLSLNGLSVTQYMPNTIKKAVTGSGHAQKEQMHFIITKIIQNTAHCTNHNEIDALAIALCHLNHGNSMKMS